jgi:hypothetical protein
MQESPLFVRTYDFLLWLIPKIQRFPRSHRFGIAERIQRLALDFQDSIVKAGKLSGNERYLVLLQADIQLAQLRHWMRFTRDLKLIDLGEYEHSARMLAEVGRLLGAWLKQSAQGNDRRAAGRLVEQQ